MSDAKYTAPKLSYALGFVIIATLGTMTIASAQSPFASKKKKQAWELPAAPQAAPPQAPAYTAPTYQAPAYQAPQTQSSSQPYTGRTYSGTATPSQPSYQPPVSGSAYQYNNASSNSSSRPRVYGGETAPLPQSQPLSNQSVAQPQTYGKPVYGASNYQDPQSYEAPAQIPRRSANQPLGQAYSAPTQSSPYGQPSYGQPVYNQGAPTPYAQQSYPPTGAPQSYPPQGDYAKRRSWTERLGLKNLSTVFRGFIKGGAGGVNRDDGTDSTWSEDFVADGRAEFEVAAITDSGYEYGINLEARAQYDKYRRGFGGRLADCPPTEAGCATVDVNGVPTALRGHTSRLYSFGDDDAKETEYALESAHLFLRSAYGDVTIGRDDGAAYLFSLGAPTLLMVGASNSAVDYIGLDSVKTVNDASGFSEKITYTSPRLLGDSIGVGIQLGASYALNARACGVDYCVRDNEVTGVLAPDLDDVLEVGLALDRTFDSGLKIEATATYAQGSEQSTLAAFDNLRAYNFGAEVSMMDITLGGSFLKSNNGLANGDYKAWDVGATWKPSALGFTLGYGHATDENVQLTSNQYVAGVTYDFDKFTLGAGAQFIERETQAFDGTNVGPQTENATALFIEGGFKF